MRKYAVILFLSLTLLVQSSSAVTRRKSIQFLRFSKSLSSGLMTR